LGSSLVLMVHRALVSEDNRYGVPPESNAPQHEQAPSVTRHDRAA